MSRLLHIAFLVAFGLLPPTVGLAQVEAPEADELPSARPNDLLDPKAKTEEEPAEERAAAPSKADGDAEEEPADVESEPPVWRMLVQGEEEYDSCLDDLRGFGMTFRELPPITEEENPDCGIRKPVEVSRIVPGVEMQPDAVMRCETARSLARWVSTFVLPASLRLDDRGPVTMVEHGSTYVCRNRNGNSDAKMSEHAFGNAIDVMGFRFASGDPIPIEPRMRSGTMAEAFQRGVRHSACMDFTTVLGPGTDAAHADHLHLDIKERRGGFRLCQ